MMINTCGIYSFPKSGNTWVREIMRGLLKVDESIDIVCPELFATGMPIEEWKSYELGSSQYWRFYKSHCAWELPFDIVGGKSDLCIYILRNPFDVFCSQLNYILKGFDSNRKLIELPGNSVDEVVSLGIIDEYFSIFIAFGTLMPTFGEASSWMSNVKFWLNKSKDDSRVVLIKYEDLITNPVDTVGKMFPCLTFTRNEIQNALATAEKRTQKDGKFFWKKKVGTYSEYLSHSQLERFNKIHSDILSITGYTNF